MGKLSTAEALERVATLVERGSFPPEARRLVDRALLHTREAAGQSPGPLAIRLTELLRSDDDDTLAQRAAIREALATLGRLMRHGVPDGREERRDVAARLRAAAEPETAQSAAKGKRSEGRRKPPVKPLTAKQAEAVQIVGECKGSISEAADKLGRDASTVRQHYQAAMAKLGQKAPVKHQTKAAPTDRRGNTDVADIDDARREIDTDEARRYKRR